MENYVPYVKMYLRRTGRISFDWCDLIQFIHTVLILMKGVWFQNQSHVWKSGQLLLVGTSPKLKYLCSHSSAILEWSRHKEVQRYKRFCLGRYCSSFFSLHGSKWGRSSASTNKPQLHTDAVKVHCDCFQTWQIKSKLLYLHLIPTVFYTLALLHQHYAYSLRQRCSVLSESVNP